MKTSFLLSTVAACCTKPSSAFTSSSVRRTVPFLTSRQMTTKISISDAFDGGNGRSVLTDVESSPMTVHVEMKKDPFTLLEKTHHSQYFSFRSTASDITKSTTVKYVVTNAGDASYPSAWKGSSTFYSNKISDAHSWKRKVDTTYNEEKGELSWTHTHETNESVYFSYFPPYSYQRHLDLVESCGSHAISLGQTLDGREMECIVLGKGSRVCWIIHRQHPGETMAEYYCEGLLNRLLGQKQSVDGLTRKSLEELYTFYIVPNMCLDGSVRGHLRTNAQGQNLNREWAPDTLEDGTIYDAPTLERSPEVYHVLQKMDETGVDVFLDVHGDEELPFNFLAGGEGMKNWDSRLETLHGAFLAAYTRANSDMQIPIGYEPEASGNGRINVASNQVQMRYDCLSVTLEQPFKDCMSNPDPTRGWNPARAMQLGASVLDALAYVHPYLKGYDGDSLKDKFSTKEDAYVSPTEKYVEYFDKQEN